MLPMTCTAIIIAIVAGILMLILAGVGVDITVVIIRFTIHGIMAVTGADITTLGITAAAGAGVGADLGMAMAGEAGTAAVGMPEAGMVAGGMADIITDNTAVALATIIPDVLGQVTDPAGQVMVIIRAVVRTDTPAVDQV